jgi:hypothetical protein
MYNSYSFNIHAGGEAKCRNKMQSKCVRTSHFRRAVLQTFKAIEVTWMNSRLFVLYQSGLYGFLFLLFIYMVEKSPLSADSYYQWKWTKEIAPWSSRVIEFVKVILLPFNVICRFNGAIYPRWGGLWNEFRPLTHFRFQIASSVG